MDLSSSSFVNDTMDSMDSILSSPADKGENSAAKNITNAGQGAVDSAVEKVSKTVSAEVDMATEKATEGDTGPKSLTDLNDNQFFENVKSSLYEEVDEKKEVIQVELNSAIGSTDLNAVSERIGASTVVNGFGEQVSEKFDEVKSVVPGEPLVSETSSGSRAADVRVDTSADSTEEKTAERDDDVFVVVKDAAMAAVADVQGGASVEDAAKKAVTNVVANVSPNVTAGLSRLSGGGSPLPTESFNSTTANKAEPRVTFNDTSDATSNVTSPTAKPTPITVLVTDTNKTTTNITHGVAVLRRQASTESRDNPFIPDGDLSKETDELLKRATIIRDKFYLDQQEKQQKALADIDTTDNVAVENVPVQESVVAPVAAQPAHSQAKGSQPATAEVKPRMRENGKVEDSVSPEGVKPEVEKGAVAPNADVSKTSPEASGENDNEKKKQKKCCNIM